MLRDLGDEYREARLRAGLTQLQVGQAVGISASLLSRIEHGALDSLSVQRTVHIGRVVGLDVSVRAYPGSPLLRDAGHRARLNSLVSAVAAPLVVATEVPLPRLGDGPPDQRAWDAMISGGGRRTGVELEMRVRDAQALERRIRLKVRDDPVDGILLLLADTRTNREHLRGGLEILGLPRLTVGVILKALRAGRHPPSGIVLI